MQIFWSGRLAGGAGKLDGLGFKIDLYVIVRKAAFKSTDSRAACSLCMRDGFNIGLAVKVSCSPTAYFAVDLICHGIFPSDSRVVLVRSCDRPSELVCDL